MIDEPIYKNNPLHGLSLKNLLIEVVDHYGFEILFAYLNINCFKTNASIESSVKFLKKTDWAREKVEAFYMYQFKSLPKAVGAQFNLVPRDRIVPEHQSVGEPAELSLEDAQRLSELRAKKAAEFNQGAGRRTGTGKSPYKKREGYSSGYGSDSRGDNHRGSSNSSSSTGSSSASESSNAPSNGKVDPWANARK